MIIQGGTYTDIADILKYWCGARDCDLEGLEQYINDLSLSKGGEWRFQGDLGMGGKLYLDRNGLKVNYYPEDQTPDRDRQVAEANKRLAVFMVED